MRENDTSRNRDVFAGIGEMLTRAKRPHLWSLINRMGHHGVDGTLAAVTQFERFLKLKRMAQKHRQSFDFINSIPLSLGCQLTKRLTYSWHLPLVAFSASSLGSSAALKSSCDETGKADRCDASRTTHSDANKTPLSSRQRVGKM